MSRATTNHLALLACFSAFLFPRLLGNRVSLQVMYPVLMIAMVYRTFHARVRPDSLIVFVPNSRDNFEAGDYGSDGFRKPSLLSRVWTGVKEDHSLFAWADRGAWETVETADEQTRLEGDQFLIGFEPLFVDFTKNGSWFMMFCLLEVRRS